MKKKAQKPWKKEEELGKPEKKFWAIKRGRVERGVPLRKK